MAVRWTEEQQRVIDTRGCDILVSAAAGSGKTAVLVARILAMITDEKKPVDIDRLLVVTFTNAAAAEMRERIRDALEKRAEEEPDNVHLQRQLVLVHNAKITTIHSFCLHVLRNHFQLAGIDPSFRVADEGEVILLEQEAVKETVDEAYERAAQAVRTQRDAETEGVQAAREQITGTEGMQTESTQAVREWNVEPESAQRDAEPESMQTESTQRDAETEGMQVAEFLQFLEHFAPGKHDAAVEAGVLSLYHFALGQPWPKEWLQSCRAMYEEGAEQKSWLAYLEQDTARILEDVKQQIYEMLRITDEPDGPYPYKKALQSDLESVTQLCGGSDYESYAARFRNMAPYARLGTKKDANIAEEKKLLVQGMRSDMKDALAALRQRYYYDAPEKLREEFAESGADIRALTRLTEAFMDRLAQKKAEKNVLDFGDLEHFALQALVERRDGADVPTAAAREYAETFEEIMIDEYQDSNLVQELILKSVSGRGCGAHNLFMVGDVKQSIYRFRLACPELFMEKYKTYRDSSAEHCRIDLHRNFRSRAEVLRSVNEIFRRIMTEQLGGIAYDDDAALYPGAVFEPRLAHDPLTASAPDGQPSVHDPLTASEPDGQPSAQGTLTASAPDSQLSAHDSLTASKSESQLSAYDTLTASEPESQPSAHDPLTEFDPFLTTEFLLLETSGQEKQREEARLVGQRILELVGREQVWDKEAGAYRPVRYGDVVILLRTVSGWADTFGEVLGDMGIPCFTGSQKGYFSAAEIRIVLSYLQILDNPVQDIPLAAVLRSAIGKISDDELARIRSASQERYFYDCCRAYCGGGEDAALRGKLERFFAVFDALRSKCGHTPVHLLIWELLEQTGYGAYAEALPAGSQRRANLDMLVEKAIAYESTSFRGLYHFVRYIENLKKYEVDYGEANIGSEAADTVRIMSIHKSKGLEFPIAFVSGLGKQFNESDIRSKLVMHPEFGAACDFVDVRLRTRQATLLKKVIQHRSAAENLGEELRVLYVALTRAKEKLILTGAVADAKVRLEKWRAAAGGRGSTLSYSQLTGASTYLDWIVPALLGNPAAQELFEDTEHTPIYIEETPLAADAPQAGEDASGRLWMDKTPAPFVMRLLYTQETQQRDAQEKGGEAVRLAQLLSLDPHVCYDKEAGEYLKRVFAAEYPHSGDAAIVGKLSVSELKKLSHLPEETDAGELYRPETVIPLLPAFRGGEEPLFGAARGTAYHIFMENLDYSRTDALEIQLEELISCGKMSKEEGAVLRLSDIRAFLRTQTGRRMARAAREGKLFRERPFVLGVPADTVRSGWNPQETVLVQGIIDAYFLEEGQITVLDYKTDRVTHIRELANRYGAQLDYYALALGRLTGYTVKDRILYSFHLGEDLIL